MIRIRRDAVTEPCAQVDEGEEVEVDAADSGACAVCTLCHDGNLWVANAGDCRAVLGSVSDSRITAASLSTDHKVDEPREQARQDGPARSPALARLLYTSSYNIVMIRRASRRRAVT